MARRVGEGGHLTCRRLVGLQRMASIVWMKTELNAWRQALSRLKHLGSSWLILALAGEEPIYLGQRYGIHRITAADRRASSRPSLLMIQRHLSPKAMHLPTRFLHNSRSQNPVLTRFLGDSRFSGYFCNMIPSRHDNSSKRKIDTFSDKNCALPIFAKPSSYMSACMTASWAA